MLLTIMKKAAANARRRIPFGDKPEPAASSPHSQRKGRQPGYWSCARGTMVATVLLGIILWKLPAEFLVHSSFDLLTLIAPARTSTDVILVQIDEPTLTDLKQSYTSFSRTNHV